MKRLHRAIVTVYTWLILFYPPGFRELFAEEMTGVFRGVVFDASLQGKREVFKVSIRELFSLPCSLLIEYVHIVRQFFSGLIKLAGGKDLSGENQMIQMIMKGDRDFETSREKWLAVLPPLLFAAGISLMWLSVGGVHWSEMPRWRLYLSVALGVLPNAFIALGAVVAILKNMPAWGYTWLGTLTLGLYFLLQVSLEEMLEAGMTPLSGVWEVVVIILLLLAFLFVLGIVALRGGWQVGLVSIGMASIFGLAIFHSVAIPPMNNRELAFLSIPVALLISAMIYMYIQGKTWHKILAFTLIELFNIGLAIMAGQVAQLSQVSVIRGDYPVMPLIYVMTVVLLCGPALGVIIAPLRRTIKTA